MRTVALVLRAHVHVECHGDAGDHLWPAVAKHDGRDFQGVGPRGCVQDTVVPVPGGSAAEACQLLFAAPVVRALAVDENVCLEGPQRHGDRPTHQCKRAHHARFRELELVVAMRHEVFPARNEHAVFGDFAGVHEDLERDLRVLLGQRDAATGRAGAVAHRPVRHVLGADRHVAPAELLVRAAFAWVHQLHARGPRAGALGKLELVEPPGWKRKGKLVDFGVAGAGLQLVLGVTPGVPCTPKNHRQQCQITQLFPIDVFQSPACTLPACPLQPI